MRDACECFAGVAGRCGRCSLVAEQYEQTVAAERNAEGRGPAPCSSPRDSPIGDMQAGAQFPSTGSGSSGMRGTSARLRLKSVSLELYLRRYAGVGGGRGMQHASGAEATRRRDEHCTGPACPARLPACPPAWRVCCKRQTNRRLTALEHKYVAARGIPLTPSRAPHTRLAERAHAAVVSRCAHRPTLPAPAHLKGDTV